MFGLAGKTKCLSIWKYCEFEQQYICQFRHSHIWIFCSIHFIAPRQISMVWCWSQLGRQSAVAIDFLCSFDNFFCKFIQIYWNIWTNTCYSSGAGTIELVRQNVGPDRFVPLSTLCCSSHPFQSVILSSLSPNCLLSWEKGRPKVFKMLRIKSENGVITSKLCTVLLCKKNHLKGWVWSEQNVHIIYFLHIVHRWNGNIELESCRSLKWDNLKILSPILSDPPSLTAA